MTDLVVAVRLRADGSGLVGQMRLSQQAVDELKRAAEQAGGAAQGMAGALSGATGATTQAGTAASALARDLARTGAAAGQAGSAAGAMAADLARAGGAAGQAGGAVEQLASDLTRVAASASQAGGAAEAMAGDLEQAGRAALDLAVAKARAERAVRELATAEAALSAAIEAGSDDQVRAANEVAAALGRVEQAQAEVARATRGAEAAGIGASRSLGAQRAGYAQLGFQIQDITQSIALGTNGFTILAQQGGQTASALEQLGLRGVGGRVAAFFAGPWGAAIIAGAAVLGPLALKLLESGNAAQEAADKMARAAASADVFGDAQSRLGKILDLTTGKLKNQNLVLVETIRLQALANLQAGREAQRQADKAAKDFVRPSFVETFGDLFAGLGAAEEGAGERAALRNANRTNAALAPVRSVVDRLRSDLASITAQPLDKLDTRQLEASIKTVGQLAQQARVSIERLRDAGKLGGRDLIDALKQTTDLSLAAQRQLSAQAELNAIDGKGVIAELRPDEKKKRPKSTAALQQFGETTGDRLRAIIAGYDDVPAPVRQAEQALNQLNAIARELEQRRPPNYAQLKEQLEGARAAVIAGRDRGLAGEIDKIADSFDQTGAAAARAREGTEKLGRIIGYLNANLADNPGFAPLIEQAERAQSAIDASILRPYRELLTSQRDQIDANALILKGREDEAQALQLINQLQRAGLQLSEDQRRVILLGVQAQRQQSRELEAQQRRQQNLVAFLGNVRGSIAGAFAGESTDLAGEILTAFRRAFAEQITQQLIDPVIRKLTDSIFQGKKVADPIERFKGAVDTTISPLGQLSQASQNAAAALRQVAASAPLAASAPPSTGSSAPTQPDILVEGKKDDRVKSIEQMVATIIGKGLGLNDRSINRLGDLFGGALKGAGTGLAVAGLAQSIGIKLDTGGAAIGGAVGSLFGPIGSIVGSIGGGLIGNLFKPTPKAASKAITSVDGKVDVWSNNGEAKNSVQQAVKMVQEGLQQIADQLNADIGTFAVSIAKYKTSFRVDPTGSGSDGGKYGDRGPGVRKFDDNDIQGAVSFAIADAIKDGAIKGISPAVAKALQSSTDINKALREALKVRDLEAFLGGPAAALQKIFDDFDRVAKDRVTLANKYGLDLLDVEKKNAEARTKLVDDTLRDRVGELQSFLDSIKYGDLFEGSAAERRRQLLAEIDKAKADQAAGVEGASARLADLLRQFTTTTRDAYGTAGPEFAADRARAISAAEAAIKIEQDRIDKAAGLQEKIANAATEQVALINESNDMLAAINAKLAGLGQALNVTTGRGGDNWYDQAQLGLTLREAIP